MSEPGIQAALADWLTLPYILAGLVAWWRRPESRFGPLMVAAGFANFVTTLSWSNVDVVYTIGHTLDLLAPVLFLHVFLAWPSGRLAGRFERRLVAAGYVTAIGLELVRMLLGGTGPQNLLQVVAQPGAADTVRRIQLVVLGGLALAGIGVLAARRRGASRLLRRARAPLVDSFAIGLVMTALLVVSAALDGPGVETIRRATFTVVGIAPFVFLIELLRAPRALRRRRADGRAARKSSAG